MFIMYHPRSVNTQHTTYHKGKIDAKKIVIIDLEGFVRADSTNFLA